LGLSTKKKIAIILISVFVVLIVLPISYSLAYQHDLKINHPEKYAKLEAMWAADREAKSEKEAKELQQEIEKEAAKVNLIQKNEIEYYFLNYKGIDKQGLTMEEYLYYGMALQCGDDLFLEEFKTEVWAYQVDYDNNESTVTLNISSKILCANGTWWFYINPQTGEVSGLGDPENKMLDFLDTENS